MLCDSVSNYCLVFYIYRGVYCDADKNEIKTYGLAHTVVTKILTIGNYIIKRHLLFVDNFVTSISLAMTCKTFLTRTIRKNRKYLPALIFKVSETKLFPAILYYWLVLEKKNKRNPRSCYCQLIPVQVSQCTVGSKSKLNIVKDCNCYVGGID